jgi:hypothetical protein
MCDTVSGKDTLLNCGSIILPMGEMIIFSTFSPFADVTIRTSLPKEIWLALRTHAAVFYQGGLVLIMASSIPAPPAYIFQFALITLLCLEQSDQVPTPMERPR